MVEWMWMESKKLESYLQIYDTGQQEILLLGMFLREQGKISSHNFHDVAGVEDGTIIVQRGYSLALNVQEGIYSWEGLLICSSIMGDAFDILHVKYWSYVLMGAYLHRPMALSLCC